MDLSKIYSKTSDWASSAAKKSKKFLNQARDDIASPSTSTHHHGGGGNHDSSSSFSDSVRNAFSAAASASLQVMDGSNHAVAGTAMNGAEISMPPNLTISDARLHIKFIKLLDEGGFSYVFSAVDLNSQKKVAVKRLLVQDEDMMGVVRHEIDIMRQLKNSPYIIKLLGVKEQKEPGSKRVVYIVMEMAKIGLIQLMQQRLEQRRKFSREEILSIFHDVCLGVEVMHRQKPPLQHRDLKVENVLRVGQTFKLCDFGSASTRVYSLDTKRERSLAEEDINKNTTLAYRSPEMCDMYSDFPITEKSDIWALGCILYKLCFFNGPFEDAAAEGSYLPIINCKYVIPKEPNVSNDILAFIREMLEINVNKRPDIWQVLNKVAQMRGVDSGVKRPTGVQSGGQTLSKVVSTAKRSSAGSGGGSSTTTTASRSSNITTPHSQNKRQDLFDLLGGPTSQELAQKTAVRRAVPSSNNTPRQQPQRVSASSAQASGFDDNDWDANFSDDDEFGEDPFKQQPTSPQSPVVSVTRPQGNDSIFDSTNGGGGRSIPPPAQKSASLLDELDWTDNQSSSNDTQHIRSRSDNFTSDLNFSGLTIHNRNGNNVQPAPASPLSRSSTGSSHSNASGTSLQSPQRPRPKSTDALMQPQQQQSSSSIEMKRNNILAALDQVPQAPQSHMQQGGAGRGQHSRFHSFDTSMTYHQQQMMQPNGAMMQHPQRPMYHTPQRPPHSHYGGSSGMAQQPHGAGHMRSPPMRSLFPQQPHQPQMHMQQQHMRHNSSQSTSSRGSNGNHTPTSPSSNPFDALFE
mmetsp:Transcript_1454/g.4955  ORF Transcript_1454/g.4955 Transcript_1454/m.4955 type:complete len:798 (-) Transcript_1454:63-2456(-)|eukprot:CAMPEP_0117446320 /NCGR_PEP_ID=MMETSP0759-20121206/6277_1 /TAXON_ID=63605 /ORGANISM="Percolomonas cosmopolitus, Strain WS" /LENGTH=797 /DNA_ID=CAMNT_0005238577 /DNA_START=178 /DNA_END=2571 /DNA_ORIENTATION=+